MEGALAAATGMVEGTVHRVTFKSASGYTVLKVNAVHVSGKPADAAARSAAPSSARKGGATRNSLHLSVCSFPKSCVNLAIVWRNVLV